jgi:hypothetical protein
VRVKCRAEYGSYHDTVSEWNQVRRRREGRGFLRSGFNARKPSGTAFLIGLPPSVGVPFPAPGDPPPAPAPGAIGSSIENIYNSVEFWVDYGFEVGAWVGETARKAVDDVRQIAKDPRRRAGRARCDQERTRFARRAVGVNATLCADRATARGEPRPPR